MEKYSLKIVLSSLYLTKIPMFGFFVWLLLVPSSSAHTYSELPTLAVSSTLSLTEDERVWLTEHPIVTMGDGIYPPLNYLNSSGQSVGIAPDYLNLVAKRLGIKINVVSGNWADMQGLARNHKLDGLSLLVKNSERQKYFDFAGPYVKHQYAILVNNKTHGVSSLADLKGMKVAVLAGDYSEIFLTENYPSIELVRFNSNLDIVNALLNKKVGSVVGSLAALTYYIDEHTIVGLKVVGMPKDMARNLYVAVRKDWPLFTSILNKSLALISEQEHRNIRSKWIVGYAEKSEKTQLALTLRQTEWLEQNNKVRVWAPNLPPYIIIEQGKQPQGIVIDYLELIAQRTGIEFTYDVSNKSLEETLENIKSKKNIDFLGLIIPRSERQEYMLFSDNYIKSPTVIATRRGEKVILDEIGISGKSIAVLKGGNLQHVLLKQYPNIELALYDTNQSALHDLAKGKNDAFVGNLVITAYIAHKDNLSNINIISSPVVEEEFFSMGGRNDWPELISIVNVALASFKEEEKTTIRNKYLSVKYNIHGIDINKVIFWLSIFSVITMVLIVFFITWNSSLRRLVYIRTAELENEVLEREQANALLSKSEQKYRLLVDTSLVGVFNINMEGEFIFVNDSLVNIFGFYDREKFISNGFFSLWNSIQERLLFLKKIKSNNNIHDYEFFGLSVSKEPLQLLLSAVLVDGVIFGMVIDISKRKKIEKALLKSQKESLVLQHIAHLGYWEIDFFHNQITASEETYRILGVSPDKELTYQKIKQQIHPDDMHDFTANTTQWINHKIGGRIKFRVIRGDGSTCNVDSIVEIEINAKGEVERLFGTMQDISERIVIERKMVAYQQRLKLLMMQLTQVEERERRLIASDLHDNVGQSLALTRVQLATALKYLTDDNKATDLVRSCSESILTAIKDTRHLIFEISSPSLSELGLVAAITEWGEETFNKKHELNIDIIDLAGKDSFDLEIRIILFRNIRELLVNVIKHASASEVLVKIENKSGNYTITVKDDGVGIKEQLLPIDINSDRGYGLFSIQERMENIGGELLINTEPNEGCTMVLTLPSVDIRENDKCKIVTTTD